MAYGIYTWRFRNSIEHEIKCEGRFGAKGEKRAPKKKATPEQIKKQNYRNKVNKIRRLIMENFEEGDLWITIKYPKGARKPPDETDEDMRKFILNARKEYRKRGWELKFFKSPEVGKKGAIHYHMIVPRIRGRGEDTDHMLQRLWTHGRINFQSLYEAGGFQALAEYIAKEPDEEVEGQLSMFEPEARKKFRSYTCSRNLKKPEPEHKEYSRRTLRKMVEEGPKPTPGFWVDKNSIVYGVNPYNGFTYYKYMEYRLEKPSKEWDNPWEMNNEESEHLHSNGLSESEGKGRAVRVRARNAGQNRTGHADRVRKRAGRNKEPCGAGGGS